jgi:hypothetical protein
MMLLSQSVRQVARQIAEDIHLHGLSREEEPLLPPNASHHTKAQYTTVRVIRFSCFMHVAILCIDCDIVCDTPDIWTSPMPTLPTTQERAHE